MLSFYYIGGKENVSTKFLVQPSMILPMVKILKENSLSIRKIGQYIYDFPNKGYNITPRFLTRRRGRKLFTKETIERWRETAKKTKEKNIHRLGL